MPKSLFLIATVSTLSFLCSLNAVGDEPTLGKTESQSPGSSGSRIGSRDCGCQGERKKNESDQLTGSGCICDEYPIMDLGGGDYLMYADQYEDCPVCTMVQGVWDVETVPLETGSCPPLYHCHAWALTKAPRLGKPKPASYDKAQFAKELYQPSKDKGSSSPTLAVSICEPTTIDFYWNGNRILARVFRLSVKPTNHELIFCTCGFEIEQDPAPNGEVYHFTHVKPHAGAPHAFDVQIGMTSCLVITAQ
jgi:hypothetical protein